MQKKKSPLIIKSLKEQVYDYLRQEMQKGKLKPGTAINMNEISEKLDISKTPLRDALIQLESENFVTIIPRRGIYVNYLSLEDIQDYYQIIGSLERAALLNAFVSLTDSDMQKMQSYNNKMKASLDADNFEKFYAYNLKFHNVFINKSGNKLLISTVNNLKKRLYDFIYQPHWQKEWEEYSISGHQRLIDFLKSKKIKEAANLLHEEHWSFNVQKEFIAKYYFNEK